MMIKRVTRIPASSSHFGREAGRSGQLNLGTRAVEATKSRRRSISRRSAARKENRILLRLIPAYSLRSVSAGSIRAMRSAGSKLAAAAMASSSAGTVARVTGSYVDTP